MKAVSRLTALTFLIAACATTPRGKEVQAIRAVVTTNDLAVQALDYGVISADEGELIQAATRTAGDQIKQAIAARKAGKAIAVHDMLLAGVQSALREATRILEGRK